MADGIQHWVIFVFFLFRRTSVHASGAKLGKPLVQTPEPLGVLYSLLVVELTPETQGIESRYGCVVQMRGLPRLEGRRVANKKCKHAGMGHYMLRSWYSSPYLYVYLVLQPNGPLWSSMWGRGGETIEKERQRDEERESNVLLFFCSCNTITPL